MIHIYRCEPVEAVTWDAFPTTWNTAGYGLVVVDTMDPVFSQTIDMFDSIRTSERMNARGDRQCNHTKAEGNVYCIPDRMDITSAAQSWLWGDDAKDVHLRRSNGSDWTKITCCGWSFVDVRTGGTVHGIRNSPGRESMTMQISNLPQAVGATAYVESSIAGINACRGTVEATYSWGNKSWLKVEGELQWDDTAGIYSRPYQFAAKIPWLKRYGGNPVTWGDRTGKITWSDSLATLITVLSTTIRYKKLYYAFVQNRKSWFRELLVEALTNVRQGSFNGIAYSRDLFSLWERVRPIFSAGFSLRKGRINRMKWRKARRAVSDLIAGSKYSSGVAKDASNAYLNYWYGWRLFLQDTRTIMKKLSSYSDEQNRFDTTIKHDSWLTPLGLVNVENHIEVFTASINNSTERLVKSLKDVEDKGGNTFRDFYSLVRRADILPTAGNVWDLIPYSFVLDWFLPIGDALNAYDAQNDLDAFQIRQAIWSIKLRDWARINALGYEGSIKLTFYHRYVFDADDISKHLSATAINLGDGLNVRNLFSGSALIFQRRR